MNSETSQIAGEPDTFKPVHRDANHEDSDRHRRPRFLITIAMFVFTYMVFCISPIVNMSDSMYSIVLSESILYNRSTHLNHYKFPEEIPFAETGAPPIDDPEHPRSYQLGNLNGNIVYLYPNGSSVLSIPFVALANAAGVRAVLPEGKYNKAGEISIERVLSALLMALATCVLFRTSFLLLTATPSIVISLAFALGTQVWSTGTRALWSHSWFVALSGVAAYHIMSAEVGHGKMRPVLLATILSWMYFVRPTGAIAIVGIAAYLVVYHRSAFSIFAATGMTWLAGFVTYNWFTFGQLIPGYYLSRMDWRHFSLALYGNLFSPSRGLFVYVPVLAFVVYLVAHYWESLPLKRVIGLAIAIVVGNLIVVAAYPCWWGGYCYGPRLMMDTLSWFGLLAIIGCAGANTVRPSVLNRSELVAAMTLLTVSIAINGRGALFPPAQQWSAVVDVDKHPERVFDWAYPQFAAGLVTPPAYVADNISRLKRISSLERRPDN